MADGAGNVSPVNSSSKIILRVKRRRSEDPADILLVSHAFKKPFTEDDHLLSDEENNSVLLTSLLCVIAVTSVMEISDSRPRWKHGKDFKYTVQRVFRLAGTVSKDDKNLLSPDIVTKLKSNGEHKSKVKLSRKNDVTVESINEKLREAKKLSNQKSRYKVVSKHRQEDEDSRGLPDKEDNENSRVDVTAQEALNLGKLYDIVLDEPESRQCKKKQKTPKINEDPNVILCNSVKMIREKLTIDNEHPTNLEILEKDYVYDVYCAEDSCEGLSDILDIIHVNQAQLVPELEHDELEQYDDDDDSNDENNWRNDYPDGDDFDQSSDEEARYRSENFDYGWQDRYDEDCDPTMFSENVSSDEDQDCAYFGKKFGERGYDEEEYNFEVVDDED